jgi:hypothetical protein
MRTTAAGTSVTLFCILASAASLACGQPPPPTSAPKDGVRLWLDHNDVPLPADPVLDNLVDLSLFGPYRPGQTLSDVRAMSGEPKAVRTDYRGTFYHYPVGTHEISIAHLTSSSGGWTWENWSLYAYPTDPSVAVVFKGALRDHFRHHPAAGDLVLSVVSAGVDDRISAVLGRGRLSDLRWYRTKN